MTIGEMNSSWSRGQLHLWKGHIVIILDRFLILQCGSRNAINASRTQMQLMERQPKALVRPHLEYGQVIWPLYFKTDLNKVENVQRKRTKLIAQIGDQEYSEKLRILKLPSTTHQRSRGDMIEVYKLLTGKYSTNERLMKINRNSSTKKIRELRLKLLLLLWGLLCGEQRDNRFAP